VDRIPLLLIEEECLKGEVVIFELPPLPLLIKEGRRKSSTPTR
jgi:hypothetical protein